MGHGVRRVHGFPNRWVLFLYGATEMLFIIKIYLEPYDSKRENGKRDIRITATRGLGLFFFWP